MAAKAGLAAFTKTAQKNYGPRVAGRAEATAMVLRQIPIGPIRLDHVLSGGLHIGGFHSFYGEKSGGKTTTALRSVAACQALCRNCYRVATDIVAVPPTAEALAEDPSARWGAQGKCTCYAEGLYVPEVPEFRDDKGSKLAANSGKYKEALQAWKDALAANSYEEYVCAWIDLELSFDVPYATFNGVDCQRLLLFRPESAEMVIDVTHAMSRTVEIDLIVLDSIAQMAPNKEIESSAEEWQQGLQARLVNKMTRMLAGDASMVVNQARAITHIWINQTREKIGVMWGDPTTKPGGKGQEFAVHNELKFSRSKRELEKLQYGDKDTFVERAISETFFFKSTKNKKGKTKDVGGSYTVRLYTTDAGKAGDLIEDEDISAMAMHFLVKQDGKSKRYQLCGDEFENQKQLKSKVREDLAFRALVKTTLLGKFLAEDQR